MSKKSTLSPEKRAELVLRLLSKEKPAVQILIARRAGIAEQMLYRCREEFLNADKQALTEREQVIGELTIANRIF